MDERRIRYHDDLRGLIQGELHFDPVGRAPYAHDAGIHAIDPTGVIVPRSLEDVRAALHYAAERALPVHARGAGTGLAGESLGSGLVLDFSQHFRRIVEIGSDSVVVQPGVVVDDLNATLEPLGRRLGPDPGGSSTCTIGGMIACDSAGRPRAILRSTELRIGTIATADAAFAYDEAEDDRSLESWRREHLTYWNRICTALGIEWTDDLEILFERFDVVWTA